MIYDYTIAGAGIVGLSTALQLICKYPGSKIALLEKEGSLGLHQTSHNSGVIHAGVYYAPGSLKSRFCLEGNKATRDFCDEHGIKYELCGKLLVATNDLELERMQALWDRTAKSGLERYRLDSKELLSLEPNIRGCGGMLVPSSGIVSYLEVARVMAREFEKHGGKIFYNHEVMDLIEHSRGIVIRTARGQIESNYFIACAGLMADRLVRFLGLNPGFIICPFRGEYYKVDDRLNSMVKHLIYPIPDPAVPFLGIHLTRMIDGSLTVGPNAVLAYKREGYKKLDISLKDLGEMLKHGGIRKVLRTHFKTGLGELKNSLYKKAYLKLVQKYCPSIRSEDLGGYPSGVRAQAVSDDGKLIEDFLFINTQRSLHVCNAPSPAATSSIPIGRHIVDKVAEIFG